MNLALFDFDGTITTREMFPDFVRLAVPAHRLALGKVLLAPLIAGYKLGVVSGSILRAAVVRLGFSGVPLAAVEAYGLEFAQSAIPLVLRPEALERINWHKSHGDTIVVVSGAFDVYLRPWCNANQVALISSSLEHRHGALTGRYQGHQCVLDEKARRVREAYDLSSYSRIYAYGDTKEDLGLLSLAHERYYQWQQMPA